MSRRRGSESLPQPPWTQAPSEVTEWLASMGGHRSRRSRPPPRQLRVRGFVGHCSPAAEQRLLRRLARFRFERVEGEAGHLPLAVRNLAHLPSSEVFRGIVAGARIRVHFQKGTEPGLRIVFTPRVSERMASKIFARLGIRVIDGTWL